jgi:hypothetical protein
MEKTVCMHCFEENGCVGHVPLMAPIVYLPFTQIQTEELDPDSKLIWDWLERNKTTGSLRKKGTVLGIIKKTA